MTNPNPLHLANTAQNMARNAPQGDANAFHKIAMISMVVMAASSVMQTLQPLLATSFGKITNAIRIAGATVEVYAGGAGRQELIGLALAAVIAFESQPMEWWAKA